MSMIGKIAKCSGCSQKNRYSPSLMIFEEVREFIVKIVSNPIKRRLSVKDAGNYYFIKS